MLFKLALKNLKAKKINTILVVIAISVMTAMAYSIVSFRPIVNEFVSQHEKSTKCGSDITIVSNTFTPISNANLDSNKYKQIPTLSIYPNMGNASVNARGMKKEHIAENKSIEMVKGTKSIENPDGVIVSKAMAKSHKLDIGSKVELELGGLTRGFEVVGIAKNKGYFIKDNPNIVLGCNEEGISKLLGTGVPLYNEMYINLHKGVSPSGAIAEIKAKFRDFDVKMSDDNKYVKEQVDTIVAPMYIAGPIVVALAVGSFILLFTILNRGRKKYEKKLHQVGATKKQIRTIFIFEAFIMSLSGAILGVLLGLVLVVGIVGTTLKSVSTFNVNPVVIILTAIAVTVLSVLAIVIMEIVSRKTPYKKQTVKYIKSKKALVITTIVVAIIFVASLVIEMLISKVKPFFAVINLVLSFVAFSCLTLVGNSIYKFNKKEKNPTIKLATQAISSQKRHMSLSVGLVISILIVSLLFTGFGISKKIFKDYTKEFNQIALVTNIRETTNENSFLNENTTNCAKMYFGKGDIKIKNKQASVFILGSKKVLESNFINFEAKGSSDINLREGVVLDDTKRQLYGIREGDKVPVTIGDKTVECKVVGFVKHTLFAGNYVIMDSKILESQFGQKANTVLLKKSTNIGMEDYIAKLRSEYRGNNFYVVPALDAFKWETSSTNSILNFMGITAASVAIFTILLIISMMYMEREKFKKERKKLSQVGMAKKSILAMEVYENLFTVINASVFANIGGILGMIFMTDAIRFLGMLFEYMLIWWIPFIVAVIFVLAYTLTPIFISSVEARRQRKRQVNKEYNLGNKSCIG